MVQTHDALGRSLHILLGTFRSFSLSSIAYKSITFIISAYACVFYRVEQFVAVPSVCGPRNLAASQD